MICREHAPSIPLSMINNTPLLFTFEVILRSEKRRRLFNVIPYILALLISSSRFERKIFVLEIFNSVRFVQYPRNFSTRRQSIDNLLTRTCFLKCHSNLDSNFAHLLIFIRRSCRSKSFFHFSLGIIII